MRVILYGAGSIGGTLAVLMAEQGANLTVVAHGEEKARLFREEGFRITGVYGDHCQKLKAVSSAEELEGVFDIALIATKYQQMPDAARELLPYLAEDSLVASLQNGLCLDLLSEVVGEARTVGVMIGFGATQLEANLVEVTAGAELVIGMRNGLTSPKLEPLRALLDGCVKTSITEDIEGKLFAKLIFNCIINAMAAVTAGPVGQSMKTRKARSVVLGIISEGVAVAEAMNITVPRFNIMPKFQLMARSGRLGRKLWGRFLQLALSIASGDVRPSTLQSLEKGKPTEVDIMNGYLSAQGRALGVPTPVNDSLTRIIKEIESGVRPLTPGNLKDV